MAKIKIEWARKQIVSWGKVSKVVAGVQEYPEAEGRHYLSAFSRSCKEVKERGKTEAGRGADLGESTHLDPSPVRRHTKPAKGHRKEKG